MKKMCEPTFEEKSYGQGGGIPVLKTIWEMFDLSLLFSQLGFQKHSGLAAWQLAFAYICGLVHNTGSTNQNAKFSQETPMLKHLLSGKNVTQCAFSRFLSTPFEWLKFSCGRLARFQSRSESRLQTGDVIALDDTKIEHSYGKKLPFLCWLFDSSDKQHVWCMNLVSTLAILQNGLQYPMLWRFWVKTDREDQKQSKLELAQKMLLDFRSLNGAKVWIAMDRWFLCKRFLVWLVSHNFDWVTKAKKNTILFRKTFDPILGRETYAKINPKQLLREVYPKLYVTGNSSTISLPDIFIKLPYESLTRKGKPITKQRMVPIAAVAGTYTPPDDSNGFLFERETAATFKNIYLLISNRFDLPEKVAEIYVKRWKIEVFYRTLKQDLGLTSCYAQSENAHFAHVELIFTAKSLLDYAIWLTNKEGAEQAPTHSEMVRYFFNASCRIVCNEQQIQVYFDITAKRFASLFGMFWPPFLEFGLWNWNFYPVIA